MTENQDKVLRLVMVGILLFSMFVVAREGAEYIWRIRTTGGNNVEENLWEQSVNEGGQKEATIKNFV